MDKPPQYSIFWRLLRWTTEKKKEFSHNLKPVGQIKIHHILYLYQSLASTWITLCLFYNTTNNSVITTQIEIISKRINQFLTYVYIFYFFSLESVQLSSRTVIKHFSCGIQLDHVQNGCDCVGGVETSEENKSLPMLAIEFEIQFAGNKHI